MAVAGVFAVTDVGDDNDPLAFGLDGADRALDDAVGGVGSGGDFVFVFGDAEEDDGADAERLGFLTFLDGEVD